MTEADQTWHRIRDVVHLAEPDYAFGAGELHLQVERVDRAHPVTVHGDTWYSVEGVHLTAGGVEARPPRGPGPRPAVAALTYAARAAVGTEVTDWAPETARLQRSTR